MSEQIPDADDLMEELLFLRKGEGVTARRLDQVPLVKALLVQEPEDDFTRLRGRFASAVHSLGDAEAALLRDVYGISEEAGDQPTLKLRREVHASRIGRGIDTVAAREAAAIGQLAVRLTRGNYAQSPLLISVPEMHGGIIYEMTSTLIVVENRRWKYTREHYRFIATFDEMDFVTITRSYPATARAAEGGSFRINTRATSGGFNDHFWHYDVAGEKEPMRRGETYDLKFTLEPDIPEAEREPLRNAYRAFHERSLLASIQVAFIGEQPARIWKRERVSHFDWPGQPNEFNGIEIDERGVASLRLRDVHGGLVSGVAWDWE